MTCPGTGDGGPLCNGMMPPSPQVSAAWYWLVKSVVGSNSANASVSGCRLAARTSLPMSARPIALSNSASRFCCSSTTVWLIRVALAAILTRSGPASAYAFNTPGATVRSCARAGRLGSTVARNVSKSTSAWPSLSARPCSALAMAPRLSLSFSGSIFASRAVSCWKTVLISTVTFRASSTAPACSDCGEGSAGGISCTYLAPNTVVDAISTSTLAGIKCSCAGFIARSSAACPSGRASM